MAAWPESGGRRPQTPASVQTPLWCASAPRSAPPLLPVEQGRCALSAPGPKQRDAHAAGRFLRQLRAPSRCTSCPRPGHCDSPLPAVPPPLPRWERERPSAEDGVPQ